MKRIYTQVFLLVLLAISISAEAQEDLFISEIADPEDDYSGRFIELYNAGSEAVDFSNSTFFLSRQSNGGSTWGDLQLTGAVAAGATFVIGGSGFETLYGFAPDQESGILIGNGDDLYALFTGGDHETGLLHDIIGAIDVDGSGEPWEYTDARALRLASVLMPNTTWTAAEWEISPADVADCDPGTHNGSVVIDPPGDFALALLNDTVNWGAPVEVLVAVSQLITEDQIISYQFDVDFDPMVLSYTDVSLAGTLAEGGTVVVNSDVAGRLLVGYMRSTPITGEGEILLLQFDPFTLDTTTLLISNAYLNNTPVPDVTPGTVIITENAPPTAVITYSDTANRFADTLIMTATFSEAMDESQPVMLGLSGGFSLADAEMIRISEIEYRYPFPVPKASGEVSLVLSNGTDLWGNEVVAVPIAGSSFVIIPFVPGDVDDDGVILAYDAALTLQYSVGIDPLPVADPMPWENWRDSTANVDGTGGITAYDAGMILQYSAGIISEFSGTSLKSSSRADVTLGIFEQHILFYSSGDLLGFNLEATHGKGMLGMPEVLKADFMSAVNLGGNSYSLGLCTASPARDGDALLKIPFHGGGLVTFHMIVNADERWLSIDLATGIMELEGEGIEIYPNPVTDRLNISGLKGPLRAGVYNIHGQLLSSTVVDEFAGEIDVSYLFPGIYMLRIALDGRCVVKKFTKQ